MLAFFSLACILLSVILISFNFRRNRASVYLGGFFLILSIYTFVEYVLLYSESVVLIGIIFLHFGFIVYLAGPMIFWYIRSVVTDNAGLRKSDVIHLLPMIIVFISSLKYLFTSWQYKIEVAGKLLENRSDFWKFNVSFLNEIVSVKVIYLSRPILATLYVLWSGILLAWFMRKYKRTSVLPGQYFVTRWLFMLLGVVFVLITSHTVIYIQSGIIRNLNLFYTLNIIQIVSGLSLTVLIIMTFLTPSILYGLPRIGQVQVKHHEPEVVEAIVNSETTATAGPEFAEEYLYSIGLKVHDYMLEFQPYLHAECNLGYFAKLLKIPGHHLAYYFREVKGQAFNDFRNEWRVRHAKHLILSGKNEEITLEAIGLLSGFSSRNTFMVAFKKSEGMSPGQFATQNKKSS